MKNPTTISRLVDIEIEAKIGAAIQAELDKGKRPSDMGKRDFASISDAVRDTMSPAAKREMIEQGVLHMVRMVFGEMIAERIWTAGTGWSTPEHEVRQITRDLKMTDEDDALASFECFKESLPDLNREELEEFPKLSKRFSPLFVAQPADATLGEIATRKAMSGDKLALSFLAWKEIA